MNERSDGDSAADLAAWREAVEIELGGRSVETLDTTLREGIRVKALYTAADRAATGAPLAPPGAAPYIRGADRAGAPINCPTFVDPDLSQINEQIVAALEGGAAGIALPFDVCARAGSDPTRPGAHGVGDGIGGGAATIYSLSDLRRALSGVHVEMITTLLGPGANALPVAASFLALLRERGIGPRGVAVHFGADPLGAWARDGETPAALPAMLGELAALARYAQAELPAARAATVSVTPYHAAGADATQEVGFALATALHYVRAMEAAGLTIEAAAAQIAFAMPIGRDVFLEIAKLRAFRWAWSKVLHAAGVVGGAPAWIQAELSPRILSARDPWVNMLRGTSGAFAAICGSADAVTILPYDLRSGQPSALGRRVARNTMNVLVEEGRLATVADPAGGAYYVEALTESVARAAWDVFQSIEKAGGMEEAIATGFVREAVDAQYEHLRRSLHTRVEAVTGVSRFPNADEPRPTVRRPVDVGKIAARVRQARAADRPPAVESPAEGVIGVGTMVDLAADGASFVELASVLDRRSPGRPVEPFVTRPDAQPFEALRDRADDATERGNQPSVFLVKLGTLAEYQVREKFAHNAFAAGGFQVSDAVHDGDFSDPENLERLVRAWRERCTPVVCICGPDERHGDAIPALSTALKKAGATRVVVVGPRGTAADEWRALGVDDFLHFGSDVHAFLTAAQAACGIAEAPR